MEVINLPYTPHGVFLCSSASSEGLGADSNCLQRYFFCDCSLFVSVSALQRKPYVMLIQLAILNCQLIHFTSESFPIQSNEELAGLNRKINSVLYGMNMLCGGRLASSSIY